MMQCLHLLSFFFSVILSICSARKRLKFIIDIDRQIHPLVKELNIFQVIMNDGQCADMFVLVFPVRTVLSLCLFVVFYAIFGTPFIYYCLTNRAHQFTFLSMRCCQHKANFPLQSFDLML